MTTRLGPRDLRALTIIAESWGVPLDLAAELLLDTSMPNMYRIHGRWVEAGMVAPLGTVPVPGPSWVYMTRSGAEQLLGFEVRAWKPKPKMADHNITVFRTRIALVGTDLERWISERILAKELGGPVKAGHSRPHIHDGRYFTDQGELWAVEVELTAKNLTKARDVVGAAYTLAADSGCDGLDYYYRGLDVRNVLGKVTQALRNDFPNGPRIRLRDVDVFLAEADAQRKQARIAQLLGAATAERRGLRMISGGAADHGRHGGSAVPQ